MTAATGAAPMVELDLGAVVGFVTESVDGVKIETYKGIPFAKFDKRFDPSYLYDEPLGRFEAFQNGPASYQKKAGKFHLAREYDCLTLDVWTTDSKPEKPLPVYVFIHGGANVFDSSASDYYQFANTADDGIVCVSINYRLGVHGFSAFRLDDGTLIANQALSDLVVGLEWVRKYVSAFGGDPGQVTIGGQSAGGYNVSYLINSPKAAGLFSRAIMQSGGDLGLSIEESVKISMDYAAYLTGREVATSQEAYEILSAMDGYDLVDRYSYVDSEPDSCFYIYNCYPVNDGVYLPLEPLQNLQSEKANRVDVLMGQNANEAAMYTHYYYNIRLDYFDFLIKSYCRAGQIPEMRSFFGLSAEPTREELVTAIRDFGEISFLYDSYLVAEAMAAAGKRVYMYQFGYGRERVNDDYYFYVDMSRPCCATHSSELGLVYRNGIWETDEKGLALTLEMHKAWVNFIKYGDPNGASGADLRLKWPEYEEKTKPILYFDEESKVCSLADTRVIRALRKVFEMMYGYAF